MRTMSTKILMSVAIITLCLSSALVAQTPGDWPQWRGPNRDGISKETGLLKQWPADGPPLVWKATGAGGGYSTMSIAGGRLYTMGLRGDREYVIAFDIATGKQAWATPNGSPFRNDRGDGPRGTPTVDGDRVYSLGGNGDLTSMDAKTGRLVWAMNVLQKWGGENPNWGISESPLVIGEKVLVTAGGSGAAIVPP